MINSKPVSFIQPGYRVFRTGRLASAALIALIAAGAHTVPALAADAVSSDLAGGANESVTVTADATTSKPGPRWKESA